MARSDARLNKEKIVEAFKDLTRNSGEENSVPTMSDVVRHSGLGRGTVYRHFPDIGSLAFEVLNDEYRNLFTLTRERLASVDMVDAYELLEDHLRRSADLVLRNRKLLLADECRISAAYAQAISSMREAIGDILEKALNEKASEKVAIFSDLLARCVEIGHLRDTQSIDDLDHSIEVAIGIARTIK